jgi:acyl-CoA reductase-like NAD-dependent aldehyde dehydrogenase
VAITGGAAAGWAAQLACARRRIPLQAELGGNNAALVAADADLTHAAQLIAAGAFEFAGQRCTANRRVVVERACLADFTAALCAATASLGWGRPRDETTRVGPLVSQAARGRVARSVERAVADGAVPLGRAPEAWPEHAALRSEGAYLPPAVLACDAPGAAIVQQETFGPVLVVQAAADWADALRLTNGVRQGLVAAAFTDDPERRDVFLREVRAGIVKLGTSTAGADVEAPFGGWKQSGIGPPEHGEANREAYTRAQAVYR